MLFLLWATYDARMMNWPTEILRLVNIYCLNNYMEISCFVSSLTDPSTSTGPDFEHIIRKLMDSGKDLGVAHTKIEWICYLTLTNHDQLKLLYSW
jgi:hypothetical protein